MKLVPNLPLAPLTSFHCGGNAEMALLYDTQEPINHEDLINLPRPLQFLGFGSNTLISDKGLPGTTIILRAGHIERQGDTLIADAGVWWDDLVQYAINRELWGLEFTSYVPGSVGAAIVGNIAAYGQAVSDTLAWVDILDTATNTLKRVPSGELGLEYRNSTVLKGNRDLLVLRAAFTLSKFPTKQLEYDSAIQFAHENNYDLDTLDGRRNTIYKARERAGSLWDYRDERATRTDGSFFQNPMVSLEKAEEIMNFDETNKSHDLLRKMNQVHGGASSRVSAAHVLLAAGYQRGQEWPNGVRLHPQHVLKIENFDNCTAQAIYEVAHEIMTTVDSKLGIELKPEIRFLGDFKR